MFGANLTHVERVYIRRDEQPGEGNFASEK
jgi:hypothetical protein